MTLGKLRRIIQEEATEHKITNLLDVPLVRQPTTDACGAACLQAVLSFWTGYDRPEEELYDELGTTDDGCSPDDIVRVARAHGLSAEIASDLEIADLEELHEMGATPILNIQAWKADGELPTRNTWKDGHYVVLVGLTGEGIVVMDPSIMDSLGYIPFDDLENRWQDVLSDGDDEQYVRHLGIIIKGEHRAKKPKLQRVG